MKDKMKKVWQAYQRETTIRDLVRFAQETGRSRSDFVDELKHIIARSSSSPQAKREAFAYMLRIIADEWRV